MAVVIDGESRSMSTTDSDFVDGAVFVYRPQAFALGTHYYYFEMHHGDDVYRLPVTGNLQFTVNPMSATGST